MMRMILLLMTAALEIGFLPTVSRAETVQVTLGISFRNARLAPLWIAEEEGYFKKQGVDLKTSNISGGTLGAQTLVSGGVDIMFDDVVSAIVATAAGVPVVEVMVSTHALSFLLVGAPTVKSVADLRGKRVGSSGLGPSASRLALIVALKRFGLDLERDQVTLVAAGQEPERIAGLASGAIAASVISPEYRGRLDQLGVNVLADLRTLNIPWETGSLITSRNTLTSKRDTIERVIKGFLEANAYVLNPSHRPRMLELLTARLGLKNPEDAAGAYEDLVKYYVLKKPYPNREGILIILAEIAKLVPNAASVRYEDVADPSILEKLDRSGYIDSLYK